MNQFSIQSLLKVWIVLGSLFVFGESLEVSLKARDPITPLYISNIHVGKSDYDWRYFDELKEVFQEDLSYGGFVSPLATKESLEVALQFPDIEKNLNVSLWKNEKVPYLAALQVIGGRLSLTVFNVFKETFKQYKEFPITGNIRLDRQQMHFLADQVQKDLFKVEGISSLKMIYTKRFKEDGNWKSEIWTADADGVNAKKVLREEGYTICPSFFPAEVADGSFYYVSYRDGQSKIYRSSLNETKGKLMISLRGSQTLPSMNMQGTQIAFISDATGRPDLFIQNLDEKGNPKGKPRQIFTAPRATQASPTYSPDGKKIAFVSDKDGSPRIYVMDIVDAKDTRKPTPHLITRENRENTSPSWSLDGSKLAYSAKVDGIRQIWVYDFRSHQETQVTKGPYHKENAVWAPDNLHVLYNTESEEASDLFRVHVKTKKMYQITNGPDQSRFASFSKRAPF